MPTPEMKHELEWRNALVAKGTFLGDHDLLALCNAYAAELERTRVTGQAGEDMQNAMEACRRAEIVPESIEEAAKALIALNDQFRATRAVDSIGGGGGVEILEYVAGGGVGGKCGICGEWCKGCVECDCPDAFWVPLEIREVAQAVLTTQPSAAKPQEAISGQGLHAGDGFIWNGSKFLRVAPGLETFAMLAMEQTLCKEIPEEEALLIMQAGVLEVADPAQPLDAGTALVLAYRALAKEARIIPRAEQQTKAHLGEGGADPGEAGREAEGVAVAGDDQGFKLYITVNQEGLKQ